MLSQKLLNEGEGAVLGSVAQLAEWRSPKPQVGGSRPS